MAKADDKVLNFTTQQKNANQTYKLYTSEWQKKKKERKKEKKERKTLTMASLV